MSHAALRTTMSASSLFISWVLLSETVLCWSEFHKNVSAEAGQTVVLPCQHSFNYTAVAVEWSRDDLGYEFVLLYRDEQIDKSYQKPSFWDRVDLQDRLMEKGDVSLVLDDARTYDTGTYHCRLVYNSSDEDELEEGPICTIHLDVAPPPPPNTTPPEDVDSDENFEYEESKRKEAGELLDEEEEEGLKEGSILLPVCLTLLVFALAFLVVRVRHVRPQLLREMMLKAKLLLSSEPHQDFL
ncbi:uncharacterized protein LOC119793961 isoform X1 [Cyprinodon tularosa]|uniref:uncharacterized protein LOC119793961 isoform X1 n=1 Tax=Cyprinodon tularosa TaxID=77115 RepID=UPI0018E1DABF|nr:uncharacterized protein LOC119793961 isoform X1 [Cyprinodon tularosa]